MRLRVGAVSILAVLLLAAMPLLAQDVYDNGPINGNISAYSFTGAYGWQTADSFILGAQTTITGFSIGAWVIPGDQPVSVNWEILSGGPDWLGGTVLASGTANFSNTYWGTGFDGAYDIYTSTVSGLNVTLGAGTYWLELGGGTTEIDGNPVYWDENDGPSSAHQADYGVDNGAIGSEAFTVNGSTAGGTTPEPGTLVMFGSGVVGLAGVIRRKLKA